MVQPDNNGSPLSTKSAHKESKASQRAQQAAKRKAVLERKILLGLSTLALVASALISALLYSSMVTAKQAERLASLSQQELTQRQQRLEKYFAEQAQTLQRLAAQPEIIASFSADFSEEARADLIRQQLRSSPSLLSLRLLAHGSAQLERDSEYPLRYAELDLITRAEEGRPALPELVPINKRWQINWAIAIPGSGEQPLGSLFAVIDSLELLNLFESGDKSLGQMQLLQAFSGAQPSLVHRAGEGDAGPTIEGKIAGSHLLLRYSPSPRQVSYAEELPSLWLSLSALITAALLALALGLGKYLVRLELGKKPNEPLVPVPPVVAQRKPAKTAAQADGAIADPLFQNQDILDITVIDEDQNVLGLGNSRQASPAAGLSDIDIPQEIFRSYDIRGLVPEQITPEFAERLGQAVGSEAQERGEQSIIVARDGRSHSEALTKALVKGILQTGCSVIDIGIVPTPLMYFASYHFDDTSSGVMVTASHNPKQYNGFKIVLNNQALADEAVLALRTRMLQQRFLQGLGQAQSREVIPAYIERIFSDVALAGNVTLVVDAGNAVTGLVAPQLFEELGCDVIPLFCELDGEFPNHEPDPTDANNLQALIAKVKETNADMGVAFDGDGDRLMVVTPSGDIIWPDRLLMLFARDILARSPGADVLFDVKCSRQLNQVVSSYGGRPIMWKTGHSPMKAKMQETGALIGGEYSGHIFIKDRWYGFDDGLYAMARLLEIITLRDQKIDDIFASFPPLVSTPELKINCSEQAKFAIINTLQSQGDFAGGAATTIDGLRVDFPKGWGLVRASNTSPALTLRFEAESQEQLEKIQLLFKRELLKADNSLALPF